MENTLDRIDMQVLPEEARAILREFYLFLIERYKTSKVEKKESDKVAIIEDLLPKKVRNFVPMTREEIYGR
jgi:cation transport regulator ChaB